MAQDAIALLEADHHRVEALYRDFKSAPSGNPAAKLHLAQILCAELSLHLLLVEEIFYPAFLQATGEESLVERARKADARLRELIDRVLTADNVDGAMAAILRHTTEQLEPAHREILAKARASGMELATLGGRIETRRAEVAAAVQEA